ncbi:Altered inheritance of mitochondria protein 24, mitochondrial [Cytospora mali]|uniref:Altered inheritance of mitochondria protein 24, mitochondrial n=1 Tax=Cytospora mali TaxID=578113 RepID=A0A194UXD2_CYTMA|nr:Altered inheritance of mitochondria protein 24, mitochondrial [Valsa mali var. pyri (nom. inval.)]
MRGQLPLVRTVRPFNRLRPAYVCFQCRAIQISASPATESPRAGDAFSAVVDARDPADARFEVLGSPYSLLSVTLSASQRLYTRRGTLVTLAGKAQNTQSTLRLLSPVSHALLGMPFLYQRISSTTPVTALIATKSPNTTFSVLHLDGTTDWQIAQRNALLAWTGHTLTITPRIQRGLAPAHWGNHHVTGRGLVALAAPGQIYQVTLGEGEELVVHPSHVVAYSVNRNAPAPFRFKSSSWTLQVPSVPESLVPQGFRKFWKDMKATSTYGFLAGAFSSLRTTARRSIFGDRLFLQFKGPTTLLMSSRGVRVSDVLTSEQVNEIADVEAGTVPKAIEGAAKPKKQEEVAETAAGSVAPEPASAAEKPTAIHMATVGKDGKVRFEDTKDLKDFVGR